MTRLQMAILLIMTISLTSCLLPYAFSVSTEEPLTTIPYANSHVATIQDIDLHYQLYGPLEGDAPLVLLVHGLGASSASFSRTAEFLHAHGYTVMAVDLPGFGYSSRSSHFDHSQENRARFLWLLADEVGGSESVWHMVGHSMGGGTVAAMAVTEPDRVASVMLIAGALEDGSRLLSNLLLFPPLSRWTQLYLERSLITEKQVTKILETAYGRAAEEHEVATYLEPLQLPGTARSLTRLVQSARSVPLPLLADLTMPIGAIWGEHDTVVPLQKAYDIHRYVEHLILHIIEGAAHIPMETHPTVTHLMLLDFIEAAERKILH